MGSDDRASRQRRLDALRRKAKSCENCDLYKRGTQTVFGEGRVDARIMVVGEQPGDQEDLAGEPFVGPAGKLLRSVLEEAGIDPESVYFTNSVKHFKWEARGKRRIHEKPNREEILACRMWLDGEIANVRPGAIVALGATAASVVLGPKARVSRDRAKRFESPLAPFVTLTVHPSSILRAPDSASRALARKQFLEDWKTIKRAMGRKR
jgi:DNA polymerase